MKRVAIVIVGLLLLGLAWIKVKTWSSETTISYHDVMIATVEKGDLTREIRAPGTLVPINLNFLTAASPARVKEILLEASDTVAVGSIIMRLDNPELTQAVDVARHEVEVLQAGYQVLQQRLRQDILTQRVKTADFKARLDMAKLHRQANEKLVASGTISSINHNESVLLEKQLAFQHALEIERLESLTALQQAELKAARAKVDKALRQLALQQALLDGLEVRANSEGIVQEIPVQPGEQVTVGTLLARVAGQNNLKVELRVQESQAKDVAVDQTVIISTGGQVTQGLVRRIDPAVQNGVVIVDIIFSGAPPQGARPDLRVEGVIELEHIRNVLKIKRPVFSQEHSTGHLFVLNETQTKAQRKPVKFGRGAVDVIEVLNTLEEGQHVIVSNTARFKDLTEISLRRSNF